MLEATCFVPDADPDGHNAVGQDELGEIWERLASKAYGRRQVLIFCMLFSKFPLL